MKRIVFFTLIIWAGAMMCQAQENPDQEIMAMRAKAEQLSKEGKFAEYIEFLDTALPKLPAYRLDILQAQIQAADKLNLDKKAALIAEEIDKLLPEGGKKVNSAAELAWRYSAIGNIEKSFQWVKTSADRGYQNYNYYLKNREFQALRTDKRFPDLLMLIKINAGIGKPAKPFERTDLNGKVVSLEFLKGKVILLDFWATWCPYCVDAMPELQKIYAEFKDKGFEIIGISADADKKRLEEFLQKQNLPWTMICDGKGWDDGTRVLYDIASIPAWYLIDKKGVVRHYQLKGGELRNAIAELLKE